ncbi:MAG: hypothetical protein ACREPX_02890 [Rhodanobacteraceae bacterium]
MTKQYTVRCKPSSAAQFKTTLWDATTTTPVQVTNEVVMTSRTDVELRADYANSDASVAGFRLQIGPTANDIQKILGNGTPSISFTNQCSAGAVIDLNIESLAQGGPYPMGPKPIIRNRPVTPPAFNLVWTIGLLLLIIVLIVWYFATH